MADPQHVTYLNDQGDPIYLDDNGEPVGNKKVEAKKEDKSVLGKMWDFATTSVVGVDEPTIEDWQKDPKRAASRAGVSGMTTPLALGGELIGGLGLAAKGLGLFGKEANVAAKAGKIAEEIPKKEPLMLPAGRGDNYIAGPAGNPLGVSLKTGPMTADIPPEIAAKISGEAIPMRSSGNVHSVDLDALRENERLRNLFYTDSEQHGATRLSVPDKPIMSAPPVAGDTRLGFEPVSRANLEYPLNVVPEAVRPRSAQEVTRALAGDEFARPVAPKNGIEFGSELPKETIAGEAPRPEYYNGKGAIEPGEALLPSAREVQAAAKNTGLLPDKLAEVASAPGPVAQAARQVIKEESSRPSMWKSVYTDLKGLSPELYGKSFRAVQNERQLKANWIPQFQNAINKLTKTERQNFGGYVEGSIPITSDTVKNAVATWKATENLIGDEAQRIGLRLFTDSKEWVPFQKNENYWPHTMEYGVSQRKDVLEKLMADGATRNEANRIVAHWKKTGEIVISPQRARTIGHKLPYRLDVDAGMNHMRGMAKRISQHIEFGPKDINGKGTEGIADLIEQSSDPKKSLQLMERIIGRNEKDDQQLLKVLNVARKYSTITKLQNFTLPNVILGQTMNAVKAASYPYESLKELSNLFSRTYRNELKSAGLWQDFAHSLTEEIRPGVDWYGVGAGETINRGIAGSVGRGVARGAFKALKLDPTDKVARKELFELLGEDVNKLAAQPELTPSQLRLAAGRMAERTQGLNVPGNVPYSWSSPIKGEKDLAWQSFLIFKKMGYQATHTIWEAVKTDPLKAIPAWLVAAGVGGELVGDSKAFLRGIWKGDPESEIEDRGSYWLQSAGIPQTAIEGVSELAGVDPEVTARLFDNYMQAFFLGLPADMLMSSQFGPEGLIKSATGPVFGDISSAASRVMRNDYKGLGKDAISSLPVPGAKGIADYLFAP